MKNLEYIFSCCSKSPTYQQTQEELDEEERLAMLTTNKFTDLDEIFIEAIIGPPSKLLYSKINNKEEFINEVKKSFPSSLHPESYLEFSLEDFIGEQYMELKFSADSIATGVITPWTIELAKEVTRLTSFLGPIRTKLPITVVVGNERYVHELTEEFMFGILSIISSSRTFLFYLEDTVDITPIPIMLDDVMDNYINQDKKKRYSAILTIGKVTFDTLDVIQGIITGANWLGKNPYLLIKDLRQGDISLTF